MKRWLLLLLALVIATSSLAQELPLLLSSQRRPVLVSVSAYYQDYAASGATSTELGVPAGITEVSVPIFVQIPLSRTVGVSLLASQATVSGEALETLTGFSDAQVILSFARRLGRSSVVVNVGANLPSGKQKLTRAEFGTAIPLSYNYYDFRVPGLGQGLSVSPGFTLAVPLGRGFVVGLGASYLYKGRFEPLQHMEERFDPGDEILVTGGLDVRLGRRSALAGDVTYTIYDRDRVGDEAVYGAGDKTTATVQVRSRLGRFDEFRLVGRYRSRAKSDVLADSQLVADAFRVLPDQIEVHATYRLRVSPVLYTVLLAGGRFFEETSFFAAVKLYDVGLMPAVRLSNSLTLSSRFIYTLGDIEGFEAGGGLTVRL